MITAKHKVEARWWYWARYTLLVLYDLFMGVFYAVALLLSLSLILGVFYYMELVTR